MKEGQKYGEYTAKHETKTQEQAPAGQKRTLLRQLDTNKSRQRQHNTNNEQNRLYQTQEVVK